MKADQRAARPAALDGSTLAQVHISSTAPLFDAASGDVTRKQELGLDRVYVYTLSPTSNPQETLAAVLSDPAVEYAELDTVGYGAGFPDDDRFEQQWGLHNTGQSGGTVDADVDAPEAWDTTTGISSTVLAIVDTGIDLDHPDLAGKIVPGYDFANDDASPQDDHGHGTHVAGIAAAATDNSTGVAGVCPDCRVMPLKGLNDENWGYYSWWANAIVYAVDNGADAINMSMGGTTNSQVLHDAVSYAYNAQVPIVTAMMNDGDSTPYYPAVYTETLAIGATDRNDERWTSSNWGAHIDLVAPGASIWSTMWDDGYASWYGTSMAAPHVTGVLGLLHSLDPNVSIEELRTTLRETADDRVGPPNEDKKGWDTYFGAGRLNGAQAVQALASPTLTVCQGGSCDFEHIQDAVDTATDGSTILVAAGTYTATNSYGGLAQIVYVDKNITIQGGYTPDFDQPPDPAANPTILDPQGQGRAIYITGNITPTIAGLHITGGDAAGLAGGSGGGDAGGGIYVDAAHATIENVRVFSNTARWGGGLYLWESDATLNKSTIISNTADWGGGLYGDHGPARLEGNAITANEARYDGGGLYLRESETVLNGNTIEANAAGQSGGGLYLYQSNATIEGASVTANEALEGGGLHLWKSDAVFRNNIVAGNQAIDAGGGLRIENSTPRMLHTTIARNGGTGDGGISISGNSTASLTNTILVSHTVGIAVAADSTARLEATLWGDGAWANGADWSGGGTIVTGTVAHNVRGDPAFVDPAVGDYHIQSTSTAKDTGVNAGIATDIDGEPRPQGSGYDIGADESSADFVVDQLAAPSPVQAGAQLTYTLQVTNTGSVTLTLYITDTLPTPVTPAGPLFWAPPPLPPGDVWQEVVVVTLDLDYNGVLTNTVQVATANGATGMSTSVVFAADEIAEVSPSQGGTLVAYGTSGLTVTVEIPPGTVTETTQMAFTPALTPTDAPPGYIFAGQAFYIDAYRDGTLCSGLVFEEPATITILYAGVGALEEHTLELWYRDSTGWSTEGITVIGRDMLHDRLTVRIEHLSEFALFARERETIYLPLVISQEEDS